MESETLSAEKAPDQKGKYEIIIDGGKPYSEWANTEEELKKILEDNRPENNPDTPHYDIYVYNGEIDVSKWAFNLLTAQAIEIKEITPEAPAISPEPFKLPAGRPIPLEDEVKLLKNMEKLFFDEQPDPELKKDMPEEFFIMEIAQIAGFGPKTQEGRRILSRFYGPKNRFPDMRFTPGPGQYSIEMVSKALKVFDYHKAGKGESNPAITITSNKDAPIKIEDEHFIFFLAPRIESV